MSFDFIAIKMIQKLAKQSIESYSLQDFITRNRVEYKPLHEKTFHEEIKQEFFTP